MHGGIDSDSVLYVHHSTGPPDRDLAAEAWMLDSAASGRFSLLTSSWPSPVVILGYGQPVADANLEWCRNAAVPVLRRLTGGTGVIHDRDLAVSLALPRRHPWARGVVSLYDAFLDSVLPVLSAQGVSIMRHPSPRRAARVRSPVCFLDQLADTGLIGDRKAVGCAQARRRGGVVVHAAVLCRLDADRYERVFGVPAATVGAAMTPVAIDDRRRVALQLGDALAMSLGLNVCEQTLPDPPRALRAQYESEPWAPVRVVP